MLHALYIRHNQQFNHWSLPITFSHIVMALPIIIKLLSSILILYIGVMARFSQNDGWSAIKKYWSFLLAMGVISLSYDLYRLYNLYL